MEFENKAKIMEFQNISLVMTLGSRAFHPILTHCTLGLGLAEINGSKEVVGHTLDSQLLIG